MKKNRNAGAIVYWIDPATFSMMSGTIAPYELKAGASYQSEAMAKFGISENYEVILLAWAGNDFSKEAVERLKVKAEEMRRSARAKL